jgi:acyl dehydratase
LLRGILSVSEEVSRMALDASLVGQQVGRIETVCDARWAMAYAAGVPDERPELYDTTRPLVVHPMFPVAPEWELLVTHRTVPSAMTSDEVVRGVHAAHDLIIERPIPTGERLTITARVVSVDRRPAGACQQMLFMATDTDGLVVWRSMLTSVFRGVDLHGDPAVVDVGWPAATLKGAAGEQPIATRSTHVRPLDAHVYTECARIWNPIHTDLAVARAAGLPAPILHGTATLARALTICTDLAAVRLGDVSRVAGSFGAMVALDSTIEIRLLEQVDGTLYFDVLNQEGQRAIRDGCIQSRTTRQ